MLFSNQSYPSLAMDEIMDIFGTSDDCVFNPIDFGKGVSSFNPLEHVDVELSSSCLAEYVLCKLFENLCYRKSLN